MLVEFTRAATRYSDSDEDDGIGEAQANLLIGVEPAAVAAVFDGNEPGVVVIKLMGGRGYKVRGTYREVVAKLQGAGAPAEVVPFPPTEQTQ